MKFCHSHPRARWCAETQRWVAAPPVLAFTLAHFFAWLLPPGRGWYGDPLQQIRTGFTTPCVRFLGLGWPWIWSGVLCIVWPPYRRHYMALQGAVLAAYLEAGAQ